MLCRIYNKKGTIEKHNSAVSAKPQKYPEIEDKKPEILSGYSSMLPPAPSPSPSQPTHLNDLLHFETSDSMPRLHTDSSGSEQAASPDFTWEKEVQSEPKWNYNGLDNNASFDYQFDFMDDLTDDPFAPHLQQFPQNQLSPLQDMFMYMQKPF